VLLAALDETMDEDSSGMYYVVAATVVIAEPDEARDALRQVIDGRGRHRAFHWHQEGSEVRRRMLKCLAELGVVAHVCVHYPTGRKKLEKARGVALTKLVPCLLDEGVDELMIESRDRPGETTVDDRDRRTILSLFEQEERRFAYGWHPKAEPLIWTADAVCGAVREHLLRVSDVHIEELQSCGILGELIFCQEH